MKHFKLKVVSGDFAGCFIGQQLGHGIIVSSDVLKNPPVDIPGTIHAVHAQERRATLFSEHSAKQGRIFLFALGYDFNPVEALDAD